MSEAVWEANWWHEADESRGEKPRGIVCELCPRGCRLAVDARGFCFVRQNVEGRMVSTTYGRSTGFCIDPIEKKPLNHFYPGSAVLSFGTAGCNLGCKFCQNWTSTKSREVDAYCERAFPQAISQAAKRLDCRSAAFTYNDPIVWAEYAIDTAKACRAVDVKTVAVTSGYISPAARSEFFRWMDAANVDLKGFSEAFYHRYCGAALQPVLDTLVWLKRETDVWVELTTLLIPGGNDSPDELRRMCDWIAAELGPMTPLHFTAFHPDFQMLDAPATPVQTLQAAHKIAVDAGLKFVYTGNIHDPRNQCTYCPTCGKMVIERDGYRLGRYELEGNCCRHCGAEVAGRFAAGLGGWNGGRQPVRIADYAEANDKMSEKNASEGIKLSEGERAAVFRAAGRRLAASVLPQAGIAAEALPEALGDKGLLGAFVTVKRKSQLRSCCGIMGQELRLAEAVEQAAERTAGDDPRFPPLSPSELGYLDMDVWLLWGFMPVAARGEERVKAVEIGRHGLQISRGGNRGLLLPGVAVEYGYDAEAFLQQVCLKAGLPREAWRDDDAELMTFEGLEISGPLAEAVELPRGDVTPAGPSRAEVAALAEFAKGNVVAFMQGATANSYLPGGWDGNVNGLRLTLALRNERRGREVVEECGSLAVKPGMPLQSSLYNLAQAMAEMLRRRGLGVEAALAAKAGLSVLWDAAMHGVAEGGKRGGTDLEGIDTAWRAVVVLQSAGWSWVYDPGLEAGEVLQAALEKAHLSRGAAARVLSMAAVSTEERAASGNVPEPGSPRPPAVAGQFYPGRPAQLTSAVDALIAEAGEHEREAWAGAMAPHAGWVYSGKLAAAVLSRIRIPRQVIVFAPKHRPGGASWAVCPNSSWLLPGMEVPGDTQLARQLAEGVEGFVLDAAAHRQEHAVEVQLPLIARMSPQTRVAGVVMHGGDWRELEQCAAELAAVIERLEERPLLLISSDMNHYESDAETRRLDRLALERMQALDPEGLLETVAKNRISMCGVTPAVLVMETLRRMGCLNRCELVDHYTSGDVSGDKGRVVGYAGVLFG